MLANRTPMKRTGFMRRSQAGAARNYDADRESRLAERAARLIASASPSPDNVAMGPSATQATPVEKDKPVRSEAYRRLVAELPCAHCGISGYSQHAHENDGKGKAMKVDDRRAMPLCCTRPGNEGCHVAFDQYRLLPGGREAHHEQGKQWSAQTRKHLRQSGLWPPRLPPLVLDIEFEPDG